LTGFGAADWKRSCQAQECGVKRIRNGWRRDSLKAGLRVVVEGFRSKTSTVVANARSVKLPDGRQVLAGSSFNPVLSQ